MPDKISSGIKLDYMNINIQFVPKYLEDSYAESDGKTVVYNNVFGKGTELMYTPLLSGVKEDIILNNYSDISTYEFIIRTG